MTKQMTIVVIGILRVINFNQCNTVVIAIAPPVLSYRQAKNYEPPWHNSYARGINIPWLERGERVVFFLLSFLLVFVLVLSGR